MARDPIYRRRGFDAEIIELCVRWYISYRLSYRDLVELMADRGIAVSHTTIMRWVIQYVPEFEKRWNRFARPVGRSWRVDETYISVRGRWHYLYRAVDKQGKTVDFLLRPDRGTGVLQEGAHFASTRSSQSYPRRPRAESARFVATAGRASALAQRGSPNLQVPQQHRRAGPPYDQATLCIHDGVQIVLQRVDRACGSRAGLIGFESASSRSVADGLLAGQ
jgi:transposase-like protein